MKYLLLISVLVLQSFCVYGKEMMVCDFESEKEIKSWDMELGCKMEISKENVTSGKSSAKVIFPANPKEYPAVSLTLKKLDKPNWKDFDYLVIEIFNPGTETVMAGYKIEDALSHVDDNSTEARTSRSTDSFALKPGKNTIEVEIAGMVTFDKKRSIKFEDLRLIAIGLATPAVDTILYIDNIHLKTEE